MSVVWSAVLWTVGLAWMCTVMPTMMVVSLFVAPDKTEWLSRLYTRGQIALTLCRYRVVVDPAVKPDAVYMFCQNHINLLDHVTIYHGTPHFKQGLELESHFKIPVYGWFMRARGTIPVRRGSEGQTPEIMAHMRSELAKGHSILAFPEGTRTLDGRVGDFRKGVFFIARDLELPIVPVAVTGMFEVMRKGSWRFAPFQEVTVHFCAPIETAGVSDDDIPKLADACREAIRERVDAYYGAVESVRGAA